MKLLLRYDLCTHLRCSPILNVFDRIEAGSVPYGPLVSDRLPIPSYFPDVAGKDVRLKAFHLASIAELSVAGLEALCIMFLPFLPIPMSLSLSSIAKGSIHPTQPSQQPPRR